MPPEAEAAGARLRAGAAPSQTVEALHQRIAELEIQLLRAAGALDSLRQGLMVIDADARIIHINAAARSAANAGLCRVDGGRLAFPQSAEQAKFERVLAGACGGPGAARPGALRVHGTLATLTVSVVPLKGAHPLTALGPQLAMVVLVDPAAQDDDDQHVLADLFALSRSETRLALMLAAGQTVQEFAAAQQCSLHTARTHLRNLMQKSGCHRQVEIVQFVQSLRLA